MLLSGGLNLNLCSLDEEVLSKHRVEEPEVCSSEDNCHLSLLCLQHTFFLGLAEQPTFVIRTSRHFGAIIFILWGMVVMHGFIVGFFQLAFGERMPFGLKSSLHHCSVL